MKKYLALLVLCVFCFGLVSFSASAQIVTNNVPPEQQLPVDAGGEVLDTIMTGITGGLSGGNLETILGTAENILGTAASVATGSYYKVLIPPTTIIPGDTWAVLNGTLVGLLETNPSVAISLGDTPLDMVHVKPLYNDNKSLPAGGVRVFSKKIEHLEPGTTYYFFPYDIDHNITYPVQKFTTVGTKSQGVQSSNNHLLLMPDGASFALEIWGTTNQEKTNMTLHGKVVPLRTGPLTLKIAWGQTSSSLSTTATVLTRNKLSVGDPSRDALIRKQLEFSYTFTGITPGTQYFFQLTDTTHNVKYPIKSFTVTNSVVGGASQASDETTALMNSVIENEPKINNPYEKTGLVPCGKKGQAMCTWKDFIKLIGNVLDYVLILIIPIIAIMCVYTGAQIIIYRDRAEELSLAKSRMFKLLIGVAVILLSWLAVSWLFKVLQVPKDYILLDIID